MASGCSKFVLAILIVSVLCDDLGDLLLPPGADICDTYRLICDADPSNSTVTATCDTTIYEAKVTGAEAREEESRLANAALKLQTQDQDTRLKKLTTELELANKKVSELEESKIQVAAVCGLKRQEKQRCGIADSKYRRITKEECHKRGCCYDDSDKRGYWCFHPKQIPSKICLPESSRHTKINRLIRFVFTNTKSAKQFDVYKVRVSRAVCNGSGVSQERIRPYQQQTFSSGQANANWNSKFSFLQAYDTKYCCGHNFGWGGRAKNGQLYLGARLEAYVNDILTVKLEYENDWYTPGTKATLQICKSFDGSKLSTSTSGYIGDPCHQWSDVGTNLLSHSIGSKYIPHQLRNKKPGTVPEATFKLMLK